MKEITKADRNAARSHDPFLWEMKPRSHEFQSLIQAFARHRMEATKALIAENERLANEIADLRLGSSINGKTIKELVSENKKLWAVMKLADEYIEDLVGHQGAEGFSETTYILEAKYDDARAALGDTQ